MPHSLRPSLPDDVLYSKLLQVAAQQGDRIIVDDRSRNTQFGYLDILNGTATLKQQLVDLIDPSTLAKPGEFFVALLAPNGYEFIVGVLATLAIGGVVVPVPIGALSAEISHIIRHCAAQVLLIGPEEHSLALEIAAQVPNITPLAIQSQTADPSILPPVTHYTLDATLALPAETPSILFFTSGTTGPPKGVLHARRTINKYAHAAAAAAAEEADDEICLIPRGTFWSIYFTKLFQMLLLGVRIEIQNFGRNYDLIWEKFRQKGGTKIVLSPTFWHGMMAHYKAHIAPLEDEGERAAYVEGFRFLREVYVTGAMPSAGLKEFWRGLRGGRPLRVLYGTTETQEIAVANEDEYSKEADLGTPLPGVTIKLSDGEQGEVLVKTPSLFLRYLHAPEDSAQKFDAEGFFKTGDFAIRQNGRIIFKGRANMDLFKFYTYKVPRLLVESRLLALPYLAEGYVMPVQDPQCDSRVAVLVRTNGKADKVDLGKIRTDLAVQLPAYQLPTVLRVLRDDETVPRTWSDKTAMAKAINLFFPQDAEQNMVGPDVEVMDVGNFMKAKTQKMWDLSGMR